MKRKTLGFLALSVSALLVLQTPATAMAGVWVNGDENVEGNTGEHIGDVSNDYADYDDTKTEEENIIGVVSATEDGDSLTVNGSVKSTGEPALVITPDPEDPNEPATYYPTPVYAGNGAEITITGDVSAENAPAIIASADAETDNPGGKVSVGGSVTSENNVAIDVSKGGSVTVGGNVSTNDEESAAVSADNKGNVDIKGNVSGVVYSNNSSTVNVDKSVSSSLYSPVHADNSSSITVGGDVSASKDDAILANNSSKVTVSGNVTGGSYESDDGETNNPELRAAPGINADNTSSVTVKGNVSAGSEGNGAAICINLTEESTTGKVIVLGDVTASGNASAIWIDANSLLGLVDASGNPTNESYQYTEDEYEKVIASLPEIIVGSMNAQGGFLVDNSMYTEIPEGSDESTENFQDKLNDALYNKIKYYIDIQQPDNGKIDVEGGETTSDGYLVANEKGTLSIKVNPNEGYELSSVSNSGVTITQNSDGTFTVEVPRGGGIKISALLKAIEKVIPPSSEAPVIKVTSSKKSDDTPSTPVLTAAKSYSVFNNTIQKDIASVPQNGTLKIDMGNWISFNKKTFELLSKRSDVAITITYKYNGQTYKVTIPAGYPIMDLLDENGYCGCLYLNSIFGSELVTK